MIKEVDGVTTVFHYDFNGNIIAESDLDGNFNTEYLYNGKGRVALVDVGTGEMYFFLNDRLGTPQMLTDASNTVVWEGIYKPFGEADVNPNSSVVNNFRFPGQYYDNETGLHYNWHRYYDPATGRYLRPDPIGHAGGINLWTYTSDNPTNRIDPDGLEPMFGSGGCEISGGYDSKEAFEEFLLENYGLNLGELKLQGIQLNLLLTSIVFESPTSIMRGAASENLHIENAFNKLLGKEYPTKLNRGIKLQPYDPKTGRFLSYSANSGLKLSPISRFSAGFGQGLAEAKGLGGATPVGKAGNIGYVLGKIIGNLF